MLKRNRIWVYINIKKKNIYIVTGALKRLLTVQLSASKAGHTLIIFFFFFLMVLDILAQICSMGGPVSPPSCLTSFDGKIKGDWWKMFGHSVGASSQMHPLFKYSSIGCQNTIGAAKYHLP